VSARVLVTDAGRGCAIAVIRSLGRAGFDVVAADHDPRSPGFRSRYATRSLVMPDPTADPAAAIDALHSEAMTGRIDLIVPVSDEVLLPLSVVRERFAGLCALAVPERDALARVVDKGATIELARELDVPVPRTVRVATAAQACVMAPWLGWPVALKPVASRVVRAGGVERFEVAYAGGLREVGARMASFEGRCDVLVQEHCAGEGVGVELLMDRGRTLMAFQHRRLHEVPITGGASSLREGVALDGELLAYAQRLLEALHWTGLAMVEFRVGEDGPVLMEVNGRIWGSLPLAIKSGVDFPVALAELYLGRRRTAPGAPIVGVRSRNLGLELVWIATVLRRHRRYPYLTAPRRREGVVAALRLLSPRDGFDVLSRDDPAPCVADAVHAASRVLRKVAHAA
jgi:predicted ATP-grasp superfamily ATP-dependent carboligase